MTGSEKWQANPARLKHRLSRMRRLEKGVIFSLVSSAGSFLVIVFAFLIPSFEEQYDRYKSHEVLEEYVKIGERLYQKEHYSESEKIFERAFELSGNQRLDIERMRLRSRVFKVYEKDEWAQTEIEELSEGDFLFLIEDTKDPKELSTLKSALGTYLALNKENARGLVNLEEARKLDPKNVIALVNLGNAYADNHQNTKAISLYNEALSIQPDHYEALYNLGVLYYNNGDCERAKPYLLRSQKIHEVPNFFSEFKSCLKKGKKIDIP